MDFLTLASQNKTVDPMKVKLATLFDTFYYGSIQETAPEQKTHTAFKCLSCLRVLNNVKVMIHVRDHLKLEKQKGDSWECTLTASSAIACFPPRSSSVSH